MFQLHRDMYGLAISSMKQCMQLPAGGCLQSNRFCYSLPLKAFIWGCSFCTSCHFGRGLVTLPRDSSLQQVDPFKEDKTRERFEVELKCLPAGKVEGTLKADVKGNKVDCQLCRSPKGPEPLVWGVGFDSAQGDESHGVKMVLSQILDAVLGHCFSVDHDGVCIIAHHD